MNLDPRTLPTFAERVAFALQAPCDIVLKLACVTYPTFLAVFKLLPPAYMAWASRVKARKAYYRALREVPAYRDFMRSSPDGAIPETDKETYIKPYGTGAGKQFVYAAGAVLLLAGVGLIRGRTGAVARVVTTLATVGLVGMGYNVGHSGGELVYGGGATDAYSSAAAGGAAGEDSSED